jgi:hypothetical protein
MSTSMADASVLGIHPPSTVRIDLDGWIQDWPFECVEVLGDRVNISPLGRPVIYYPYEHARPAAPGLLVPTWFFHGRQSFVVKAGPAQLVSCLN